MSCYTTGTFDMIHKGHIEFLKACKKLTNNKPLIIGLTTDELAVLQKRKPIMSYDQRRSILVEFPFVDLVVPHAGEPKETAWKRLKFTDIAIGVEYEDAKEYKLPAEFNIRVHFIPCPLNRILSSTQLTKQLDAYIAKQFKILSTGGPSGILYKYEGFCRSYVMKTIRVSHAEYGTTANVYNLPIPNPRNWKRLGDEHVYPNIQGVNTMREIEVQSILREFVWNPVRDITEELVKDPNPHTFTAQSDYNHLNFDRLYNPKAIYTVSMKYAGQTLEEWIDTHENVFGFILNLNHIIRHVRDICNQLKRVQVVHGDLHERNICVDPVYEQRLNVGGERNIMDLRISVIDFGWCLAPTFNMEQNEREYLTTCLENDWDYKHFKSAIEYTYYARSWFHEIIFNDLEILPEIISIRSNSV